jgi:ABC-type branched-subunit amino acid transport system substrate-binding protein
MSRAGALQLVQKQGAKAIITDSSQDDIAINMLAYDGDPSHALDVPIVCMACTSPAIDNPAAADADPVKQAALRNGKGWNFRTTMSDSYQARLLAHMLVAGAAKGDTNGDGHLKLGIYASDDPYGHGFSESLKADVLQLSPGASVEQIFHDMKAVPAEYHWGSDVAKLTDKRNESTGNMDGLPDAVVVISFPKFEINFTRAWLDSGTKVRLVHTHNFRAARVIEVLSTAVEGQEGTSQAVLAEGNSARVFSEDLKGLTGMQPAFRDAAAYDAAMTLMLATVHAAKQNNLSDPGLVTGAMIRDSLRAINDPNGEPVEAGVPGFARAVQLIHEGRAVNYQGASGPCDYDQHGDVVAQLARFHVQAAQFLDAEKFDCVRDRECPPVKQLGSK